MGTCRGGAYGRIRGDVASKSKYEEKTVKNLSDDLNLVFGHREPVMGERVFWVAATRGNSTLKKKKWFRGRKWGWGFQSGNPG